MCRREGAVGEMGADALEVARVDELRVAGEEVADGVVAVHRASVALPAVAARRALATQWDARQGRRAAVERLAGGGGGVVTCSVAHSAHAT